VVVVEDLDVKGILVSPRNSRNTATAAWNTFTDLLGYNCKREGTHFVKVDPDGTIKECAQCGVETDKTLWVREHSCPACGFEADRDTNAACNVLFRGLTDPEVGHSELPPVETALAVDTAVVPANRVVEAETSFRRERSPCLKQSFERPEVFRDEERAPLPRTTAEGGE